MKNYLRISIVTLSAVALAGCAGEANGESNYPEGTVNVVLPYSAGGVSDFGVRAFVPCLEDEVGGTWVIENRPGGAGATATQQVLQADPDGYTLGVGTQSTIVTTPVIEPAVGYDYEDFVYLGQIMEFPSVIMVHPESTFESLDDLLEAEEEVTVGTSGSQVSFSLATEQLSDEGYPFTVVPFQGTAEANTAALGQNVDVRWEAVDETTLELIESGALKPLAVSTEAAAEVMPDDDVPTFSETDMPSVIDTRTFYPMIAPPGVPDEITNTLEDAVETCVSDEEFASTIGEQAAVYASPSEIVERLSEYREEVESTIGG